MTTKTITTRFQTRLKERHGAIGSCALLMPQRWFLVLGTDEHHDIAVFGETPFPISNPQVLSLRPKSHLDLGAAVEQYRSFQQAIQSPQVASLSLRSIDVTLLRRIIRQGAITHLRFFTAANDTVTVHAFDGRRCFSAVRLRRKGSPLRVFTHELSSELAHAFSVTLKASAFQQLPVTAVSLSVRASGLVACEWGGDDFRLFLRDQSLIEPITVFTSEAAEASVALILHWGD